MQPLQFALKEARPIPPDLVSDTPRSELIVQRFLQSLREAAHRTSPYDYWVLDDTLPEAVMNDITGLPFDVRQNKDFSHGTRESNNDYRVYFTPENQRRNSVIRSVITAFKDRRITGLIENMTGKNLARGRLRIEYCQDTDGFWLEPHVDIGVKLFSMIVYLSDDPALRDAGTDIYDASPAHNTVATIPYEKGKGMFFMPSADTWHGFSKRPIRGIRKSLIVNYVTPEWRDKWELA